MEDNVHARKYLRVLLSRIWRGNKVFMLADNLHVWWYFKYPIFNVKFNIPVKAKFLRFLVECNTV